MSNHDRSSSPRQRLQQIARRAMVDYGFAPDFSAAARTEADHLTAAPLPDGSAVRDLRDRLWCSIDNDDTRDMDQLTVSEAAPDGGVRLLVAIADVDSLVSTGSAIDDHARQNTTSIYTPAEIFWMLPERLSTDLTSLVQDADRPALVVDMLFDASGTLQSAAVDRAIVRNRAKLAYDSLAAWLDGTGALPAPAAAVAGMDAQLRTQDRLAHQLRQCRQQHGALDLRTIESRTVFDDGQIQDLKPTLRNRAHDLIEDAMIAANGASARFLQARGLPSLRRVVRTPDRWPRIVDVAAALGDTLPAAPDAAALQAFLARRLHADPDSYADLSHTIVKLLGRGEYVAEPAGGAAPGHFSLAVRDYTHSTAPNRRFPDLITQRLLKGALSDGPAPYTFDALQQLAQHCTDREDAANRVERRVQKSAAALLLEHRIGNQFDGIVTGASSKGTWVRVFSPPVEGKVISGGAGLDVGDHVRVRLVRTDVERGFIDFAKA